MKRELDSAMQGAHAGGAVGLRDRASLLHSARWRRRVGRALLHITLISVGFSFLIPMLWVLSTSLKRAAAVFVVPIQWIPTQPQWSNYVEVFNILPFATFIRNTSIVSVFGAAGSVINALIVGYSLSRLRWPGRNAVFVLLLATMMLPNIVLLVPWFVMVKSVGWLDTFYPLILPAWLGYAFYIFLMRQFMLGIPIEFDEAARIDGASSLRILWQLIAPMSKPAIATVAIFSFLAHYNDFLEPLIFLSSNNKFTLTIGLYLLAGRWGNRWNLVMAASMITLLPVVALFFAAQRYFVQGIQFSGLTGR